VGSLVSDKDWRDEPYEVVPFVAIVALALAELSVPVTTALILLSGNFTRCPGPEHTMLPHRTRVHRGALRQA
jgi:hypothetical protein